MTACRCSICNGPITPGSELERLDLFDLRVADGHLAAVTVQDLRTLDPAVKHHLCSNCATLLARRQRLLNVSLKAEAEMELDEWAASIMPPATEKPTGMMAEGQDGVVNKTNQSDSVTTSSAFQPGSLVGSSLGIKNDVTVIKVIRLDSRPHMPTVKLENRSCLVVGKSGVPDSVAMNVKGLVDLGNAKRKIASGPEASESDNAMQTAKCDSDTVAGARRSGAPPTAAAEVKRRTGGVSAAQSARCRRCPTCSRCRDVRKAALASASVEHYLAALARSSSHQNKDMSAEQSRENLSTGHNAQNCTKHNMEACQTCKIAVRPFRGAKDYHSNERDRLRCVSCVKCSACQAAESKESGGTRLEQISRFVIIHCTYCKLNLESMSSLLYHLDLHNLTTSPYCSSVSQTGATSSEEHSKTKQLCCHICSAPFENVPHLLRHLDTHNTNHTESKASKELHQSVGTRDASLPSAPPRSFACSGCGTRFRTKAQLNHHKQYQCLTELGVCPYCGYEPKVKLKLRAHIRLHVTGRVKCQTCHMTLADGVELRRHHSVCIGRKFVCELCGRRFRGAYGLKRHMNECHRKSSCYCCHLCPESFYAIGSLRTHVEQHDPEADLQCGMCPARFLPQALEQFRAHMRGVHRENEISVPGEC